MHSEEELAGSYNWDYLLDWGPQYQPLAHVFQVKYFCICVFVFGYLLQYQPLAHVFQVRYKQNLIHSSQLNHFLLGNFESEG